VKKIIILITLLFMFPATAEQACAEGYIIPSELWIRAVIHTEERGAIDAVWQKGGEEEFDDGSRVVWGYFYASPDDVIWGNQQNPDVFVKIWFDRSGRLDVNFFHVSVPDIEVWSDYPYDGVPDQMRQLTLSQRYIRQYYENGQGHIEANYEDGESPEGYWAANNPSGYTVTGGLKIGAVINTFEKDGIDALWHEGGRKTFTTGHRVIWGYFYANPDEVGWGSLNNPDLFVKIWFDRSGRLDVNFFHVSVPDIEVYSDFQESQFYHQSGTALMSNRYIMHNYSYWYGHWTDPECSPEKQNEFLYDVMTNSYLWYDKVPELDYKAYASTEQLFDDMLYELDQWSFIISAEDYYSYIAGGNYFGMGFGFDYNDRDECRITFVYEDSPADKAGIRRNDSILEINGKSVKEIQDNDEWENAFGRSDIGVAAQLEIENEEGIRTLALEKDQISIDTILHHDVLEKNGLKIGYLVFNSFLDTSQKELDTVFAYFKWKDIDELILDLRYNGGGVVAVAEYLANLIAGERFEGKLLAKHIFNDKYEYLNEVSYFVNPENQNAHDLGRVVFITSEHTASASEMLINVLKPYVDVVTVGETTHGKPVGYAQGWDFCDLHVSPINFRTLNSSGEGNYFEGISPTCYAADDLSRAFGDTEEASLKTALYYLTSGVCSAESESFASSRQETETERIELRGFRKMIGAF